MAEIQIPSLLRIKPHAIYKLGKYLRTNGLHTIALDRGEGIMDLLGEVVGISLDSSEITVAAREVATSHAVEDVVHGAFRLPTGGRRHRRHRRRPRDRRGEVRRVPHPAPGHRGADGDLQRRVRLPRRLADGGRTPHELQGDDPVRRGHRHAGRAGLPDRAHLLRNRRPGREALRRRGLEAGRPLGRRAPHLPRPRPDRSIPVPARPAGGCRVPGDDVAPGEPASHDRAEGLRGVRLHRRHGGPPARPGVVPGGDPRSGADPPGYVTVLGRPGAVQRLTEYVANDPFWDAYLAP